MPNQEQPSNGPTAISVTSKSPKRILGRAQAALSSLSNPADSWGVSDVPVLSPRHIVPRRSRPPESPSFGDLGSRKSDASSRIPTREPAEASLRVSPVRPLSISSVSTFGSWMPDKVYATNNVVHACVNTNATRIVRVLAGTRPGLTPDRQAMGTAVGLYQHTNTATETFPCSNSNFCSSSGAESHIYPLRMHPPTTASLLLRKATADQNQDVSIYVQTSGAPPSPGITPSEDEVGSRPSYDDSRARPRHPVFARLDVGTADRCVEGDGDERDAISSKTGKDTQVMPAVSKDTSVPRDTGYVDTLRRWYEEKEMAAKGQFSGYPPQTC